MHSCCEEQADCKQGRFTISAVRTLLGAGISPCSSLQPDDDAGPGQPVLTASFPAMRPFLRKEMVRPSLRGPGTEAP